MLGDVNDLKARISRMLAANKELNRLIADQERALWAAHIVREGNFFRRKAETWRLARLKVPNPSHEDVFSVLDELSDRYLATTPEQRIIIRELFDGDAVQCLISYAGGASDRIASAGDAQWLRRGLAALSMADNRLDFRDIFTEVRELYLASARARIDPGPFLQEAAGISSPNLPAEVHRGSVRDHFMNFDRTEFFKQDVEPYLPKESGNVGQPGG